MGKRKPTMLERMREANAATLRGRFACPTCKAVVTSPHLCPGPKTDAPSVYSDAAMRNDGGKPKPLTPEEP